MIYQFGRCQSPQAVCDLIEELEKTYKRVKIIAVTGGSSYLWVYYKLGRKK